MRKTMTPLPLFYSNIAVLDRNTNRDLRVEMTQSPYAFATRTHVVPALAAEFTLGCRDMPILFLEDASGISPLFLVGMRSHSNLFIGPDGRWAGKHIPAYVRRYPFIGGEMSPEQSVICIDPNYAGFGKEAGDRLFNDEGEPTEALQRAIAFVAEYAGFAAVTTAFTAHLKSLDLLKSVNIDIQNPNGPSATFHGFLAVDETRFNALSDEAVLDLRRKGYLAPIYAHLISLSNFAGLGDRAVAQMSA
jgi:hypothetical protein